MAALAIFAVEAHKHKTILNRIYGLYRDGLQRRKDCLRFSHCFWCMGAIPGAKSAESIIWRIQQNYFRFMAIIFAMHVASLIVSYDRRATYSCIGSLK